MSRTLYALTALLFSCSSGSSGPGTIRVTVSGVASTAGSGGRVVAISGMNEYALDLPASSKSTGSTTGELGGVAPGTYQVQYTPPKGHQVLQAALNPRSVEVSGGATATVMFAAQPVPQPTLVFASDWQAATGNTDLVVRDARKWDFASAFEMDRISVVSSTGLGFPAGMANVLAVRYPSTDPQPSSIAKLDGWTLPNVGGSVWFRIYFRYTLDGTTAGDFHPVQPCYQADACCAQSWWSMSREGTDMLQWSISLETGTPMTSHQWATSLSRNVTYRIEEQWERTAMTTWRLHLRVYDQNDSLIRDDASFGCVTHGAGTHVLSDNLTLETASPACLQHKLLGTPGALSGLGSDNADANRVYYGGFAVSLEDWVGPYAPGEAD